jgi:aminodeoxyfutalosine synthase
MLYGHVETVEDRVDHLLRLRGLQDETGGFSGLIPLAFHPENTPLAHLPQTSGQTDLRVIAVSRLLLDNFPHIKAYWIQIGTKLAQIALFFGADDLVGTVVDETITHAAGAQTASGLTRTEFERIIRQSGREPFERDADYRRVVRGAPAAEPAGVSA